MEEAWDEEVDDKRGVAKVLERVRVRLQSLWKGPKRAKTAKITAKMAETVPFLAPLVLPIPLLLGVFRLRHTSSAVAESGDS